MSASFAPTLQSPINMNNVPAYGPPPGLAFPPGLNNHNNNNNTLIVNTHVSPIPTLDEGSAHGESESVSPGEGDGYAKPCTLSTREHRDRRQCAISDSYCAYTVNPGNPGRKLQYLCISPPLIAAYSLFFL